MPKAPTSAPQVYLLGHEIILEWPTYALRFPKTEGGFAKVLKHVPTFAPPAGYLSGGSNLVANKLLPKIAKSAKAKREIADFSEDQRQAASAALRKIDQ